jgi:hypothetical protein
MSQRPSDGDSLSNLFVWDSLPAPTRCVDLTPSDRKYLLSCAVWAEVRRVVVAPRHER